MMASFGRDLPDFCADLEIDLEATAAALQIDISVFDDFNARISLDKFCRLLNALATLSDDDGFGVKYGQFSKTGATGPFGFGLSKAPNFKDMLNFYVRYVHIITDVDSFDLVIEPDRITIEWTFSPLIAQRDQFVDYCAAAVMKLFEYHVGGPIRLLEAELERRPPEDKSEFVSTFSRRIKFNAEINKFVFPVTVLDSVNASGDKVAFDYMAHQCEAVSNNLRRKKDIITLLKEDFVKHMESTDSAVANVARRLGMSERTLQRRLAESDSGFWAVHEETKDELSMRLLVDTDLPLSEISRKLGYSSQSAYTRAVKRWHGKSPGQLRDQR
ncbi:MAG: AraC family transcriptional regulator [Pseudomonadales bacterium]